MRLQLAVLTAVATFLASVTAAADSKMAVTPAMGRNNVPVPRLLRTGTTTEEDDEERAPPLPSKASQVFPDRTAKSNWMNWWRAAWVA
ncbi:hypothetical protein PF010_g18379 [Phytophthora fragariae]|uniref:RxLR effector protein n=1 Tax=Phytophthora fragariae TaxID=53985 RepID=A0A6G0KLA9_9STRA|nr:hypothetical protein PF010_g18379 [Phytophthora fragariae]